MISWGGTSMVTVLRSILTILSTNGSRMNKPGPLAPPCTRPRRKTPPRSSSFTILIALSMSETTAIATITKAINTIPAPTACNKPKFAYIRAPPLILILRVHGPVVVGTLRGHHLHRTALAEAYHGHLAPDPYRRPALTRVGPLRGERQHGLPQLAVHEHPPRGPRPHGAPDGTHLAYHPLLASEGTPPPHSAPSPHPPAHQAPPTPAVAPPPAGGGPPPPESARRPQNPEERAPQERRDGHDGAEHHPRVGDP